MTTMILGTLVRPHHLHRRPNSIISSSSSIHNLDLPQEVVVEVAYIQIHPLQCMQHSLLFHHHQAIASLHILEVPPLASPLVPLALLMMVAVLGHNMLHTAAITTMSILDLHFQAVLGQLMD